MIECVKKFIEKHYINRFLCVNMEKEKWKVPEPTPEIAGYKDFVNQDTFFYFFPNIFINEVCAEKDYKAILKKLLDQGLLMHDKGMYTFTTDLNQWRKNQKVVAVSSKILDPWFPHVYYEYIPR